MAKSKNGGSRAYLRGRIGSDVYSVGKNGLGEKQQVVRSLAEQVSNPRTSGQMFGRMIMSTVMQAVSGLQPIIDHSFDGVPKGQPSISQFIKANYALIKADAIAHPAASNTFGLNKYQEKGAKAGAYQVSDGNIVAPSCLSVNIGGLYITLTAQTMTVGGLKAALGLSADGYITFVRINNRTGVEFFRAQLTTTLADSTAISDANVGSLFTIEGNITVTMDADTNLIEFGVETAADGGAAAFIISEKVDGAWKHNKAFMTDVTLPAFTADVALPTYPVGQQMFLNGGDI